MLQVRHAERGFTLLELLVVVTILGVLSAVVVLAVDGFSNQADKSACQTDARALTDAEEVHHAETGTYVDEDALVTAGRLRAPSTLHDIVLTTENFGLVPLGDCAEDGEVAAAVGDGADRALRPADQNLDGSGRLSTGRRINRARDDAAGLDSFSTGWTAAGDAAITDGVAVLTPEQEGATGAVFLTTPVTTDGLRVTFTATSGKGAEGFAFALLDADTASESPGKGGSGLGFAGLNGYGVTIASTSEKGVPIVGITDGHDGFKQLDSTAIDGLADGWHEYTVEVRRSVLVVSVDGMVVLSREVQLGRSARLAFTAATGESPASQIVGKVSIGSQRLLTGDELKQQADQQAVLELLR